MTPQQQAAARKVLAKQRLKKLMPQIDELVKAAVECQKQGYAGIQGPVRFDL